MQVAAIIQARMKSTRLPGKVLMRLGAYSVLGHIIKRLRRAETIGVIAITTSTEPEDDAIATFGAEVGVPVFRGPEDDVLMRFAIAARALSPDIIVRVTGDSPLIDPECVDFLVREMQRTGADFLKTEDGFKCIQEGVDPFSKRALDVLLAEASTDPVAREHVTGWLKLHDDRIKVARIAIDPAFEFSGARLSIDTPADLEFFAALARRADLETVSLKQVAALLKREPWLLAINAHVHQKAATQSAATVLVRADGGGRLGFGHLTRALAIAEALRDREGVGVLALTGAHADGNAREARDFFEARKIPVQMKRPSEREIDFIFAAARRSKASALVLDVRTALSISVLESLRASGLKIIAVDDASPRRLAADIAVYPPVPQAGKLGWKGFRGELLIGREWVLLSSALVKRSQRPNAPSDRLLITMGGSDPLALTEKIAVACAARIAAPIDVVLGPSVADAENIAVRLGANSTIHVHRAPADPAALYAGARLAVASFGVTAYELACLGVPALYVALTDDHARSVQGSEALGFGKFGAMAENLNAHVLAGDASKLWNDHMQLAAMSAAGRESVDGMGAERLARRIATLIRREGAQARSALAQTLAPNRRRHSA